jgi:hypothetical protein
VSRTDRRYPARLFDHIDSPLRVTAAYPSFVDLAPMLT